MLKPIPKCMRKPHRLRMFSTNFPQGFTDNPEIRCFVPWEDYMLLRRKYEALAKRYARESCRRNSEVID